MLLLLIRVFACAATGGYAGHTYAKTDQLSANSLPSRLDGKYLSLLGFPRATFPGHRLILRHQPGIAFHCAVREATDVPANFP
jgi:hypothetical protein